MNTLVFWLAFFAGMVAMILIILIFVKMGRSNDKASQENREANERSLQALKERNEIDRGIAATLREIAENLKKP